MTTCTVSTDHLTVPYFARVGEGAVLFGTETLLARAGVTVPRFAVVTVLTYLEQGFCLVLLSNTLCYLATH